jgi:hypothetical protein
MQDNDGSRTAMSEEDDWDGDDDDWKEGSDEESEG